MPARSPACASRRRGCNAMPRPVFGRGERSTAASVVVLDRDRSLVEAARRDPARFDAALDRPYPMRQHGAMVYLMPWRTGLLRGYGRLRDIARLPSFFEVFNLAAPGPLTRRVAGLVILIHPDPDVLSADVARLRAFEEDGLYRFEGPA